MTDGTTATLSPVQENEMNQAKSIFERMAEAVVQASTLVPQIAQLQADLNSLKNDLEATRRRNNELDEFLSNVRGQRDQAIGELNDTKAKLTQASSEYDRVNALNGDQAKELEYVRSELAKARSEAMGWEQAAIKADEDLQKANAKLAEIKAMAQSAFGLTEVVQTLPSQVKSEEPVPMPVPMPMPEPIPFTEPPQAQPAYDPTKF